VIQKCNDLYQDSFKRLDKQNKLKEKIIKEELSEVSINNESLKVLFCKFRLVFLQSVKEEVGDSKNLTIDNLSKSSSIIRFL